MGSPGEESIPEAGAAHAKPRTKNSKEWKVRLVCLKQRDWRKEQKGMKLKAKAGPWTRRLCKEANQKG